MRSVIKVIIVLAFLLLPAAGMPETYYIDWSSGDDANSGTSKTTPWKRAPGMYGCSDNCLIKQNAGGNPGDQFILKGGVTWPRAALSWDWYFGNGTTANPIYFGVDQTWYTGGSWSRPILDAEDGAPNPSAYVQTMFRAYGDGFVIDNFEFTGLAQLDDVTRIAMLQVGVTGDISSQGIEVKNCYFHGWSHGGTATKDTTIMVTSVLWSLAPDMNLKIHDNVWDGSDTTKDMGMAYKGSVGHFYNNYIGYMTNGLVTGNARYIWGNTFDHIANDSANKSCIGYPNGFPSFDCTCHMNSIENMDAQSIIYNNYFINPAGGVTIWVQPKGDAADYIFNNVVINDSNQGVQISNQSLIEENTAGVYIFNNTFQAYDGAGVRLAGPSHDSPYLSFMTARNNHIVGGGTPRIDCKRTTTCTESSNTEMTNDGASIAGYVTGAIPFFPPAAGTTIGAGADLSAICGVLVDVSPSLAATACAKDTTLGVSYNSTSHTVTGDGRTAVARPQWSAWDIGAYEYVGGTTTLSGTATVTIDPAGGGTVTIE